uniref:Holliday junction resolvase RuvC n=1 Tax=viral metagenome TaxID=1070528 RepID=A0A6H1ZE70_9ZZZZ
MNLLALDLGTTTGWAAVSRRAVTSGTWSFQTGRYEGGGMRFLRFRKQLEEAIVLVDAGAVLFEEVRAHRGTSAAHVYGGLLALLTSLCEELAVPYQGVPVGTIKRHATGKGNANKAAMVRASKVRWPREEIKDDNQADALCLLAWGMEEYGAY